MKDLFLTVMEISISGGLVILAMLIFSSYLNRRYAAKWKYFIWIMIALRLIVPLNFKLPDKKIVVDVPERITAPINVNVGNAAPVALQAGRKITQITPLDIASGLWLAGCLLFLAVHLFGFLHFRARVIRDGEVVEDEMILRRVCGLAGELGIKPNLRVVRYPGAGSPMVFGFFKPVLVLPECAYRGDELTFILKHELIHLRRHDVSFKLLFVVAGAVHWFNPLVYVMRKEAVVDMELSCDESVVSQTSYAVRKAYTETLFATLNRQCKRETTLTTQFYGGKKIMQKRFKNILNGSEKRNGAMVCICAVCLTLASGMLVGCSAVDHIVSGAPVQPGFVAGSAYMAAGKTDTASGKTDTASDAPDMATETLQNIPADTDSREEQVVSGVDSNNNESDLIVIRSDSEQIINLLDEFAAAYFSGDVDGIKSLAQPSYAWDVTAYEGSGTISDIAVKGLPDAGEQPVGSVWTVSIEYRDSAYEDMFQYLTVELIKRESGWEIQFYGLEG